MLQYGWSWSVLWDCQESLNGLCLQWSCGQVEYSLLITKRWLSTFPDYMQFSLQRLKLISLLHERMGRVFLIGWSLGEWKRQIKKIWNNDFSPVICMIKLLSKARINFFFQNLSFHRLDVFTLQTFFIYFSCLSLHIWQWVMFLAAIIWDKSWMLWDTAMPMTSFTETSSPTACCLRARRTPPPSNSEGSVWPLRSLRAVWFLEVCLNLLG